MKLQDFKRKLLENPQFRKEYYRRDLAFDISIMLVEARILKGVTQAKLAEMIKTKQSGIARIENGKHLPSLSILEKIAKAFNTRLVPPKFEFMVSNELNLDSKTLKASQDIKVSIYSHDKSQLKTDSLSTFSGGAYAY